MQYGDLLLTRTSLSRLHHLQNRDVRCGLRKYDYVSQYRANLGWLPMSQYKEQFSQCLDQHYLGEGIFLQPTIDFDCKHFYNTRCSPWFADFF